MTIEAPGTTAYLDSLVNVATGELDRRIFSDEEIFELEMQHIFGRAWLFLCHETQIPKKGDFFEAPMGKDNVLVVRQRDRSIKALLNTCTHRGNAVCRAEEGNVRNFMCTYHGWTFGLDGELVGVPGMSDFYRDELDRTKHPLRKVAQLDNYKGFIFATMDPQAPPLLEFLGRTGRIAIDLLAERGDIEARPGVQKFTLNCNWKFTADNAFDYYHPQITHISAQAVGMIPSADVNDTGGAKTDEGKALGVQRLPTDLDTLVALGEFGHAISGPSLDSMLRTLPPEMHELVTWRQNPGPLAALGPVGSRFAGHPHLFPTAWFTMDAQISLRVPRSAGVTEVWWFSFKDRNESPEEQKAQLGRQIHSFGPAGFLEQEDGENWSQSTAQTRGGASRDIPQLLKMGLGRGKIIHEDGVARIEAPVNEHAQLWTYLSWLAWVKGTSWDELRSATTPGDYI
ncbi:nitrite reductase/ring-hydroxylating ferredoxin subunit [Streptomyces sp. SAI-133]|uniref:aromatic ring-hydroxylating oxygenase subunit alpha n=1 Tax=unclassified Streptomyces TaxID=2593676 RepID=UPI00247364EB|nr:MULTISPECIES: Rieske 2Fe-2S domain-containing protein [unclassified Streptomyces]MDH6554398.1 nitrite reductase/ring-hydroxylating ferredoxin subunit [Streptomyces sp. SAI-041]MDH6581603.1 nitrite reductase/ring-hydroxylating ferredoxin subunit [Streptomyces sp. SAI-133]